MIAFLAGVAAGLLGLVIYREAMAWCDMVTKTQVKLSDRLADIERWIERAGKNEG